MSNQTSSRGTAPVNPYLNIPSDRAITLDQAKACFAGRQNFIAVSDHITYALNDEGNLRKTVYTNCISNHQPSDDNQQRITYYGNNASLREADDNFLRYQTGRLRSLKAQVTGTTWGSVTPGDFDALCRHEQLNTWLNIPIERQSVLCQRASTQGSTRASNADVLTLRSTLDEKITAFCGRKPYSFVQTGYTVYLDTQGNVITRGQTRHHTNAFDARTTNSVLGTLSLNGETLEAALKGTRGMIIGHNTANITQGVDRGWIEVSLEQFNKISNNVPCNARHYGGLEGTNVGRRVQGGIPPSRTFFITHFPS